MNTHGHLMVVCVFVTLLARPTMALGGFEMELLMTKMDYLQYKLQEMEQTVKTTIEEVESKFETKMDSVEESLQKTMSDKFAKLEQYVLTRIDKMDSKIETRLRTMEESLKKSVKASEDNTESKLNGLKNLFISKVEQIHQQQIVQSKCCPETSETILMKLGETKEILDTLTNSIDDLKTHTEKSGKILSDNFNSPVRSCRYATSVSGKYMLRLWENSKPFEVFCEQEESGGGWTVIQHRFNGSVDFFRDWVSYRDGFGSLDGEFWLGLEYMHQLTKNRPNELLVEMKDFHGNYGYAKYEEFEIGSETEGYALKKLGTYSGTAGDSMNDNKNQKFSTFDRENDKHKGNCAQERHGAWWYWYCSYSNLNGRYLNTKNDSSAMAWYDFKNGWHGMSYSRMMIRDIIN